MVCLRVSTWRAASVYSSGNRVVMPSVNETQPSLYLVEPPSINNLTRTAFTSSIFGV